MSLSSLRWRENRVRQEAYKEHLKHRQASSDGASLHGSNGTTIELDGQTPEDQPAQCRPNRRKKRPTSRMILPPPFLGGSIGLWYWIYLSQLESTIDETVSKAARGRHTDMSLSSLRWRDNRLREEIVKEHLKHRQASSDGASLHGSNGTTIELDGQAPEDQPAQRTPNRRNKHPIRRVILPPPFLGGSIGLWYWTFLSQLESTVNEQQ
jgi:hypothetical protein